MRANRPHPVIATPSSSPSRLSSVDATLARSDERLVRSEDSNGVLYPFGMNRFAPRAHLARPQVNRFDRGGGAATPDVDAVNFEIHR